MKKISKLIFVALFGWMLMTTATFADVKKGHKIYLKKLKVPCGFSATKFAHKYTKDEWEAIKESGKFFDEVKKLCPKAKIKSKYISDVYDFVYEYAKDSGNVPSC